MRAAIILNTRGSGKHPAITGHHNLWFSCASEARWTLYQLVLRRPTTLVRGSSLSELRIHVIRVRERLRHKREIIRAYSRHCGYTPSFPMSFPLEREIRRWTRAGDTITLVRLSRARFWVWERWSPSSQKLFRNGCLSVLSGRLRVLLRRNEPTEDTAGWSQRPRRHRESGEDEGRQDDGAQVIETS